MSDETTNQQQTQIKIKNLEKLINLKELEIEINEYEIKDDFKKEI